MTEVASNGVLAAAIACVIVLPALLLYHCRAALRKALRACWPYVLGTSLLAVELGGCIARIPLARRFLFWALLVGVNVGVPALLFRWCEQSVGDWSLPAHVSVFRLGFSGTIVILLFSTEIVLAGLARR